jgi:hypothetical protein
MVYDDDENEWVDRWRRDGVDLLQRVQIGSSVSPHVTCIFILTFPAAGNRIYQ